MKSNLSKITRQKVKYPRKETVEVYRDLKEVIHKIKSMTTKLRENTKDKQTTLQDRKVIKTYTKRIIVYCINISAEIWKQPIQVVDSTEFQGEREFLPSVRTKKYSVH